MVVSLEDSFLIPDTWRSKYLSTGGTHTSVNPLGKITYYAAVNTFSPCPYLFMDNSQFDRSHSLY